jgi:ATP-dependent Lon protease
MHTHEFAATGSAMDTCMSDLRPDFSIPTNLPTSLPVLALRRGVLLPGVVMPLTVGRDSSLAALKEVAEDQLILIATQREPASKPTPSDLLQTAVLARITEVRKRKDSSTVRIVVVGLSRAQITGFTTSVPYFEARFTAVETQWPDTTQANALADVFRDTIREHADVLGGSARAQAALNTFGDDPDRLADLAAALLEGPEPFTRLVLTTSDPVVRAEAVTAEIIKAQELDDARKAVKDRIDGDTRGKHKEFVLRQQLEAIKKELGEGDDDDELALLKTRLAETDLPDEARKVVDRELKRLERIANTSPERAVAMDWLEWVADLPWNVHSGLDVDLNALETAMDKSHYGLGDVKRQVVEHLAVRKLAGSGRADVLLLVGPPGVGKTSIAQAIADATGRKLVRAALGGVRDEAELRGHRRTYIGARPGRIVEGIRRAGTADPVVLLDEVDKLAQSFLGNPAAALLEILDPEQNHAFTDHYLEVPFDLSKALFIATANDLSTIPAPLRDRMEVIDIAGYTRAEKQVIARQHLLERVARNAGLEPEDVELTEEALEASIAGWTREAGVRQLQRVLGKLYRTAAVKKARNQLDAPLKVDVDDLPNYLDRRRFFDESHEAPERPGIATGMAWTPVGGTVLYVEATTLPGKGQLILTGQLGDVMKESARAALTYVLSEHEDLGISPDAVDGKDIHIHVPAGAVPKDGPSAGVTMFTAMASLLTGKAVRGDTAMTGEATLRGRVLPVGGIKAKVLAAHRQGLKRIIIPKRNGLDLHEVPKEAREELEIVLVDHMDQVLKAALVHDDNGSIDIAA